MLAYRRGEEESFRGLYERYSGRVYGYLRLRLKSRSVVDDAFQTVFLKLHRSRSQYRPALPFAPWLFTICRNVVWDALRAMARRPEELSAIGMEEVAATEPLPSSDLPELRALPAERRRALELRFGQELSFQEIADRLETSPGNARQLVSRALRQLRRTLGSKAPR